MDTKILYVKSQKNILNWGLIISTILFSLSAISIVSLFKKPVAGQALVDTWVTAIGYTVIFASLLTNRFKRQARLALIAFYTYLALGIYFISMQIARFKSVKATFIDLQLSNPSMKIAMIYGASTLFIAGIAFLYYRVFKATQNIESLENEI